MWTYEVSGAFKIKSSEIYIKNKQEKLQYSETKVFLDNSISPNITDLYYAVLPELTVGSIFF